MEATLEHPKPRRRGRKVVAGVVVAALWLSVAGIAYAAFLRQATGTVTISTSAPSNLALSIETGTSVTFSQAGQTQPLVLRVTPTASDAGGSETYTKYALASLPTVASGPCAGFVTATGPAVVLPGGSGSLFRNTTTGATATLTVVTTGGTPVRTEKPTDTAGDGPIVLQLSASAPASCANTASIPLDVALKLIP